MAVTESMGAIADRTLEHLSWSDRMIALTRHCMRIFVSAFPALASA